MEIINSSIEWCQERQEITITGIKKVSKYDIQCILSRNPRRFVVNMLNEDSIAVLEKIKEKTDIPYLEINHIRNGGDNLINGLPAGIMRLKIGYDAWNKDIRNLPGTLRELHMSCFSVDDCQNLPHGLEFLDLILETSNVDLSNLPSSIKTLFIYSEYYEINLSCIPSSIKSLDLHCNDSNIIDDEPLEHIQHLSITCMSYSNYGSNSIVSGPIIKILNKFSNCKELQINLDEYQNIEDTLEAIPKSVNKITLGLKYLKDSNKSVFIKDAIIKYHREHPEKEIIVQD